jgi:hypothetical protein
LKILPSLTMTFVPITNITFAPVDLSGQWTDKRVGSPQIDTSQTGLNCHQEVRLCGKEPTGYPIYCTITVCS